MYKNLIQLIRNQSEEKNSYKFGTVFYQFLETGTSDRTLMGLDQLLKCLRFQPLPPFIFPLQSLIQTVRHITTRKDYIPVILLILLKKCMYNVVFKELNIVFINKIIPVLSNPQ